jgi:hypothetical protein
MCDFNELQFQRLINLANGKTFCAVGITIFEASPPSWYNRRLSLGLSAQGFCAEGASSASQWVHPPSAHRSCSEFNSLPPLQTANICSTKQTTSCS